LHEEDVVLEACVEVWFEAEVDDDRVVVAVDMCIHAIETFEDLKDEWAEGTWEGYTYSS
jgi:hypothetical protein